MGGRRKLGESKEEEEASQRKLVSFHKKYSFTAPDDMSPEEIQAENDKVKKVSEGAQSTGISLTKC